MNNIDKIFVSRKIAVFGWPASGKSTLGRMLSNKFDIKLYSLDLIRWKYSSQGIKDDNKFLNEYEKILLNDQWIIEGNALDFIDSRLKQADLLIFFDSTVEQCIKNYNSREEKVQQGMEDRLFFDSSKTSVDTIEWIKSRYSKKIEKLRIILNDYQDKLMVINNYDELDNLIEEINKKV